MKLRWVYRGEERVLQYLESTTPIYADPRIPTGRIYGLPNGMSPGPEARHAFNWENWIDIPIVGQPIPKRPWWKRLFT